MPFLGLPRRYEMQHMDTFVRFTFLLALLAAQLDTPGHEEGAVGGWVYHLLA